MKKNIISTLTIVALMAGTITGCANTTPTKELYKIGITKYADHEAANESVEGFVSQLEKSGFIEGENLEIYIKNAAAKEDAMEAIGSDFASQELDLAYSVGTVSTISLEKSLRTIETPIIYSGVANPVASGLVNTNGKSNGNAMGVSTINNIEDQIALIKEILPDALIIGVLYNGDDLSVANEFETFRALAEAEGLQIAYKNVTSTLQVTMGLAEISEVSDCIVVLNDDLLSLNIDSVISMAKYKGIPTFGSNSYHVELGCIAGYGLDYYTVGEKAGEMAASILLENKTISKLKLVEFESIDMFINSKTAEYFSIELPQSVSQKAIDVVQAEEE